jgi:hypothetical protein
MCKLRPQKVLYVGSRRVENWLEKWQHTRNYFHNHFTRQSYGQTRISWLNLIIMRNVSHLKGNKLAAVFSQSLNLSTFYITAKQMSQVNGFNPVFNENLKIGSAIFVPFVS